MKLKLFALGSVIAVLSACGVSPKIDPMSGFSSSSGAALSANGLPRCTLQQESDNSSIVSACRDGVGDPQDCIMNIQAFLSRYPNLRCASSQPNLLATGNPNIISAQYVSQYQSTLYWY